MNNPLHILQTLDRHQNDLADTVGVYPLLHDETCWFLAADFDKSAWQEDAAAFLTA